MTSAARETLTEFGKRRFERFGKRPVKAALHKRVFGKVGLEVP